MLKFFLGCIAAIMGLFGCSCGSDKPAPTEFSVSANPAFVAPTVKIGSLQAKVGSFTFTASKDQAYEIYRLVFDKDTAPSADLQILRVRIDAQNWELLMKQVVHDSDTMTAEMSHPVIVPAGASITVDVYADVLFTSAEGTHKSLVDLTGWSVRGSISGSAVVFPGEIAGQDIKFIQ